MQDREKEIISFSVPTRPVPKLRARNSGGGRPRNPEKTKTFERRVQLAAARGASAIGDDPILTGDVFLFALFRLGDDRRVGDLTNYLKAIEDACNGSTVKFTRPTEINGETFERGAKATVGKVWEDDRHVASVSSLRVFDGSEGVDVIVSPAGRVDLLVRWARLVEASWSDQVSL